MINFVNDGGTLVVVSRTPLSVADPGGERAYIGQSFRVVADQQGPTLVLVPVGHPVVVPADQVNEYLDKNAIDARSHSPKIFSKSVDKSNIV